MVALHGTMHNRYSGVLHDYALSPHHVTQVTLDPKPLENFPIIVFVELPRASNAVLCRYVELVRFTTC